MMAENSHTVGTPSSECTEDYVEAIRQKKYDDNPWSLKERAHRCRSLNKDPFLAGHEVSFSTALLVLLRRSVFGGFLKRLNEQQVQDKPLNETKLAILDWDIKSLSDNDKQQLLHQNSFTEDVYQLLMEAVKACDVIDYDFLYERIRTLRAANLYINKLDEMPRNFKNLEVLVLTGNWLKEVPGANLPRKLKFLELYGNQIEDLTSLAAKVPPQLRYLGLGRNKLNNESKFHLFKNYKRFGSLRCLDLSENDISDLLAVVHPISRLKQLLSLQLEGNPCYVQESYKQVVLKYLPALIHLDATEILEKDRDIIEDPESILNKAAIVFTCHRIMGLPAPPKENGVDHVFHVEVFLPLMEEIDLEPHVVETPIVEMPEPEEDWTKEKDGKNKNRKEKTANVEKQPKGLKKESKKKERSSLESFYYAPDEYADELKKKTRNMSFKTESLPWAKVIQFSEEAIVVEHPTGDLKAIRDTFRSIVNIKIIYLKVKAEGVKKAQGKDGQVKQGTPTLTPVEAPIVKEQNQVVLKRVTLASFDCELHDINWSDATIDFHWENHPKSKSKAIPVEGSLRSICYAAGNQSALDEDPSSEDRNKRTPLPNIFTCQVGFGLKRL